MRTARKRKEMNVKKSTIVMSVISLFVSATMIMSGCGRGGGNMDERPERGKEAAETTVPSGTPGGISFHVDGKYYRTDDYFATYDPSDNSTGFIGGPDGEGGWNLGFDFEGKGEGSYKAKATLRFETFRAYSTEDLNVTITSYGGIRERIVGTFSGTLISHSDPNNTIAITEGKFAAWRTPF